MATYKQIYANRARVVEAYDKKVIKLTNKIKCLEDKISKISPPPKMTKQEEIMYILVDKLGGSPNYIDEGNEHSGLFTDSKEYLLDMDFSEEDADKIIDEYLSKYKVTPVTMQFNYRGKACGYKFRDIEYLNLKDIDIVGGGYVNLNEFIGDEESILERAYNEEMCCDDIFDGANIYCDLEVPGFKLSYK